MNVRATIVDETSKFIGMIPVRAVKAAGWLSAWPLSILGRSDEHRSVFVIAVPRSGSTLLYNLIAWNDSPQRELAGYGENCASYRSARDTDRLRSRTMCYLRTRSLPTHVVDKLVQSRYLIEDAVLSDERCYFIFLERNANDVIASLERKLKLTPADARAQHAKRCAEMAEMQNRAANSLVVTYENLLADPTVELERISRFLDLNGTLSTHYEIPPNVDNFSYGDDGELIRRGTIVPRSD